MTDIQNQLDALYAQALDHFRAERFGEAEALGREILALQPKLAQTLHLMSAVALRGGRMEEAAVLVERAIALDGRVATFHNTLGEIRRQQGQVEQALPCYERALAIMPDFAHARGNIEQILAGCDDKVAIAYYRRQVEAQPGHAPALANLASAFARAGEAETAVTFYRQGLALNAAMPNVLCNLGLVLSDLGRLDEAIDCYLTGLKLQPESVDGHNNLSLALLLKGDYATAWPHHEYRPQGWKSRFNVPAWKGEDLAGRRILLHSEQGFGDTLQFVRYVPLVAARGGRVVLELPPPLMRLLGTVAGAEEVIPFGAPLVDIAWHCPLMSLPLAFGTALSSIPNAVPYIAPPAELLAPWRARVGTASGLKVGLVWQGQPKHRRDRDRSVPPAMLASLAEVPGIRYFALQKRGDGTGFDELPPALRQDGLTTDLAQRFADYADTAAAIAALDLVITVDTSVAHLAGALGKPVWVLLHKVPDWRWGEAGENAPWYPSARLFRQREPGDWRPVVADLVAALTALAI